jgi:hypothetical protein
MSPRLARSKDFDEFARRSLFVAALVAFGVLLWLLRGVLLLIFAMEHLLLGAVNRATSPTQEVYYDTCDSAPRSSAHFK